MLKSSLYVYSATYILVGGIITTDAAGADDAAIDQMKQIKE